MTMIDLNHSANEIWGTTDNHINCWLGDRQQLIKGFCELSGITTYNKRTALSGKQLQDFCERLVDYVSAGHFGIYEELLLEAEAFNTGKELIQATYPKLKIITNISLEFNDKYEASVDLSKESATLIRDLSKLGEALELRFELEDQLINILHLQNKTKVA